MWQYMKRLWRADPSTSESGAENTADDKARPRPDRDEPSHAREGNHKVLIYASEAARLVRFTCAYTNIETGGDLFGYWTHGGSPVVSLVTGPGRGSRHHATSFYQDEGFLHDVGVGLYDRHGLQHVGEWHSHHKLGLHQPSGGDINTVRVGMRSAGWSRFLLLITTFAGRTSEDVLTNFYLFDDHTQPEPLRIVTLPGRSPFREHDLDPREEMTAPAPSSSQWRAGPFTPSDDLLSNRYRKAWFARGDGKDALIRAITQFRDAGVPCRVFPAADGSSVRLALPDANLVLDASFPAVAPSWRELPADLAAAWSAETNVAEWYRDGVRARHREGGAHESA